MSDMSLPPSPLLMLRLLTLLLLASFPVSVSGQTYYTALVGSEIYSPSETISARSSCHCKVICASRTDCIAATFVDSTKAPLCCVIVGPEAMVATVINPASTTWFKFVYKPSEVFLSTMTTQDGTLANLAQICKLNNAKTADLLTQKDRVAATQIVAEGFAWLGASDINGDGAFEWGDGSAMLGTVFQASDLVQSGPSVMLGPEGMLTRSKTNTYYRFKVLCIR